MRFTLAQLEAFYWIARLGKFQEAARQLNITQPTISLRIRDLEQTLGASLFERVGRQVRLTNEGEVLLDLSSTILAESRKIQERLGAADAVQGVFRLGLPENFAIVCLPEFMRIAGRDYDRLRIEFAIGTSVSLASALDERRIDAAVVTNPQSTEGLQCVPLGEHQMFWAAGREFELKEPISPGDIRGLPIIANPQPEPQYLMIKEWFRSAGLAPLAISTCTSVSVIVELVANGVGLSLLPMSLMRAPIEAGRLQVLRSRPSPPQAHMFFCYHASEGGSNIAAVLRTVRAVIGKLPVTAEN
jgi:DNA-binding transcriptional LysR family regulator